MVMRGFVCVFVNLLQSYLTVGCPTSTMGGAWGLDQTNQNAQQVTVVLSSALGRWAHATRSWCSSVLNAEKRAKVVRLSARGEGGAKSIDAEVAALLVEERPAEERGPSCRVGDSGPTSMMPRIHGAPVVGQSSFDH